MGHGNLAPGVQKARACVDSAMARRILLVDDDPAVLGALRRGLARAGFDVLSASDGHTAVALAMSLKPDLVVLDITLPDIDGFQVCSRVREVSSVPILMLTASDTVPDRVTGLDNGADDYVVKPFIVQELHARIRALLRRTSAAQRSGHSYAGVVIEEQTKQAFRDGRQLNLTALEYELLTAFVRHPRQVLSRDQLSQMVWGYPYLGESNFVDVAVMELRRKLESGSEPRVIQTVRSRGYALREA